MLLICGEKTRKHTEIQGRLMKTRFIEMHQVFAKKRTDTFLTDLVNENPTRALNTISLKCCLPSTALLTDWKKIAHAYECSRSPHASGLYWKPPGICKKNKVGYFSNRPYIFNLHFKCISMWWRKMYWKMNLNLDIKDIILFRVNNLKPHFNIYLPADLSSSQWQRDTFQSGLLSN